MSFVTVKSSFPSDLEFAVIHLLNFVVHVDSGFSILLSYGCQVFGTVYMDLESMPPPLPSFNYYRFVSKCLSLGPSQVAQW